MSVDPHPVCRSVYSRAAVSWALFDFASTAFAMNVMSRFALLWVINEKGGTDLDMATAVMVSLVAAGVVNVLLAPVSDALGQRAVFVRLFGSLCVLATALLGTDPPLWGALALIALANFANQSAAIFYTAMLPDVSSPRTLGRLTGLSVALGYVGGIIALLAAEWLRGEQHAVSAVFVPTAILYFVTALPQFLFVRDLKPVRTAPIGVALRRILTELAMMGRLIWRHPQMRWFMLAMLLYLDVHGTATIYMAGYANFALGMDGREKLFLGLSEISLFLIVGTVFAALGAWVTGLIADWRDKLRLLADVLVLWCVALAIAVATPVKWPFWIAGPMIGIAMGGVWVLSRSLLIELGWPEHRTKLFTLFALVGRTAGVVGPLLWGLTVHWAAPLGNQMKYRAALTVLLLLMCLATWIVHRTVRMRP